MEQESKFISEKEIERNVINISSKGETETERMLSNFAYTPFELDGVHYESVEGFWQSLKFPEGSGDRTESRGTEIIIGYRRQTNYSCAENPRRQNIA